MRFFFKVIEGACEIADSEGTELADEAAAQSEAVAIACELCREFPGRFHESAILEVFAEDGRRIMALPIKPPDVYSLAS